MIESKTEISPTLQIDTYFLSAILAALLNKLQYIVVSLPTTMLEFTMPTTVHHHPCIQKKCDARYQSLVARF